MKHGNRSLPALVAVVAAFAVMSGGVRAANAQQPPLQPGPTLVGPPPPNPPPADPPSEPGLASIQILLGTLGLFLSMVPIALVAEGNAGVATAAILFAPSLSGLIVCGVGQSSAYYEGGCGAAVLGAEVGALLTIPLAVLGCALDRPGTNDSGCFDGAVIGLLLGYFVGSAVGGTIGWNLGKRPRVLPTPALPPPYSDPARGLDWRPEQRRVTASPAFQLTMPILTFNF